MDITSPFIVVPILAVTFLSCILTATLTSKEKTLETPPDPSSPGPDSH